MKVEVKVGAQIIRYLSILPWCRYCQNTSSRRTLTEVRSFTLIVDRTNPNDTKTRILCQQCNSISRVLAKNSLDKLVIKSLMRLDTIFQEETYAYIATIIRIVYSTIPTCDDKNHIAVARKLLQKPR